jgi:hypothetical protein
VGDTRIELPMLKSSDYINVLTGEPDQRKQEGKPYLDVSTLLGHFPVALFTKTYFFIIKSILYLFMFCMNKEQGLELYELIDIAGQELSSRAR